METAINPSLSPSPSPPPLTPHPSPSPIPNPHPNQAMDEFKSNGAAKLKNALRWLVEFVRYHCLREVGQGKEEEGREEIAYRPTEVPMG